MTNLHLLIPGTGGKVASINTRRSRKRRCLRRNPALPVLEFVALSPVEAEEVLTRLWYVLEEYALATPEIRISFSAGDEIDLRLSFPHAVDSMSVADALEKDR